MRSFNVGNTELMIMELLSLALPLIFLILLFFLVRKAVSSGVWDAMSSNGSSASRGPSRPLARPSTGTTRAGSWRGRSI
jgi:hypothetical protein